MAGDWELISPGGNHPRTCILAKKIHHLLPMWGLSTRDLMVAKTNTNVEGSKSLIIGSAYLPYDQPGQPPTLEVKELVNFCEEKKTQLVLCCDSNAHHTVWGSTDNNRRGESLLEFIVSNKLEVANRGNEPTFVTQTRSEVIDITIGTPKVCSEIRGWHVSTEPTLSDHRYIRFNLNTPQGEVSTYRNPKTCDWTLFRERLGQGLDECPSRLRTPMDVELMNNIIKSAIINAYEESCPLKVRKTKRETLWWNPELSTLRAATRTTFNRAKRTGDWEEYKASRLKYTHAIKKAKEESWRRHCEEIEKSPVCARLQKTLQKGNQCKLGSLKKPQGGHTATGEETLDLLLETHFPGCKSIPANKTNTLPQQTHRNRGSRDEWKLANKLVDITKIVWAVKSFKPYKSAGPDGIQPIMLQQGIEELASPLCTLFRASLALSYVPQDWRKAKVVFIPKPGRDSYAQGKSFRPISLTSFMLKTIEKLVDKYIRDDVLDKAPLHRHQYAYQAGKSCELSLHELTHRIEKSLGNQEVALGVFLDIEGAFDNTSFDSIRRAVVNRGVDRSIADWIGSVIEGREIFSSLGNVTRGVTAAKGCPQGGVLSPLLWSLVVDSLLWKLDREGIHVQGYADDITILVSGKFGGVISNLTQRALGIVETWCTAEGLTVNPAKTTVVAFTRRRKLQDLKVLRLWGKELQLSSEVKYLGLLLDTKLNFTTHLEKITIKATRALWACRQMTGKTWGLKPGMILWMYTKVVLPTITYGSLIWWHKARKKESIAKLSKLQRLACLSITGAMSTTPTAAMETLLGLPPLHLVVESEALSAAYRLRINGHGNTCPRAGYHTEIFKQIHEHDVLTMPSDKIQTIQIFHKPYRVTIPMEGVEKMKEKIDKQDGTIWYTDGSKTEKSTGVGVANMETGYALSINLGRFATVFQAEITAITVCAQEMVRRSYHDKKIQIITDSQAALSALNSVEIRSKAVKGCVDSLTRLAEHNNKITLKWTKSHQGNEGNEKADLLAKRGAKIPLTGPEPSCCLPYQTVREEIENLLGNKHTSHWRNAPGLRQSRTFIGGPFRERAKELINLGKNQLRWAVGLFTGHCPLMKHLTNIKVKDDPDCRLCGEEEETPLHILSQCSAIEAIRHSHFGDTYVEPEEITTKPISLMLKFFEATGLMK